jgi:hypothetical protein
LSIAMQFLIQFLRICNKNRLNSNDFKGYPAGTASN